MREVVTGAAGDVFVGGAYNVTYGVTDVLAFSNCGVATGVCCRWAAMTNGAISWRGSTCVGGWIKHGSMA